MIDYIGKLAVINIVKTVYGTYCTAWPWRFDG